MHQSSRKLHCSCPEGYEGDGKNNGTGCSPNSSTKSSNDIFDIIALSEYN